jgi:hypothetical protein
VMTRGEPFTPDPIERFSLDPETAKERAALFLATLASAPGRR